MARLQVSIVYHSRDLIFRNNLFNLLNTALYQVCYSQVSYAGRDSCHISRKTVVIVDECPDTEGKWREAAAKKNCSAYASQCREPDRLVYHCVINPYVNQTLEVCAYAQNIVLGKTINCITERLAGIQYIFFFLFTPPKNPKTQMSFRLYSANDSTIDKSNFN